MRRTRENDAGITWPSHFTKKVCHIGTGNVLLPDKIVLRSHARPKDDVEARKGKFCWEIQSVSLFHRSSLCWKDYRLRVQQKTPLTYSQRQVCSFLVCFNVHVTGNVNQASVVDAEIRAAQLVKGTHNAKPSFLQLTPVR